MSDGRIVVAVDLGGTNVRIALVGEDGTMHGRASARTPREGSSGAAVTDRIVGLIRGLLPSQGVPAGSIAAIGVSSAGPLDICRGRVVRSPNMAFPEIEITGPLGDSFGLPVHLINDCRAGVLGERWMGAGRGCDNLVYITFSTGIGGGAVVDGRLLLGKDGNAGEIGHLIVDSRYHLRCGCGHEGHWEAYASGRFVPGFFSAWQKTAGCGPAGFDAGSAQAIFAAAHRGDPVALEFVEELGRINARGMSNVIVAYNPGMIVLDGPLVQHHEDLLLPAMHRHIDRYLSLPRIVVSTLSGRAPLFGAAAYALQNL